MLNSLLQTDLPTQKKPKEILQQQLKEKTSESKHLMLYTRKVWMKTSVNNNSKDFRDAFYAQMP